jgi:hypothetical protein
VDSREGELVAQLFNMGDAPPISSDAVRSWTEANFICAESHGRFFDTVRFNFLRALGAFAYQFTVKVKV